MTLGIYTGLKLLLPSQNKILTKKSFIFLGIDAFGAGSLLTVGGLTFLSLGGVPLGPIHVLASLHLAGGISTIAAGGTVVGIDFFALLIGGVKDATKKKPQPPPLPVPASTPHRTKQEEDFLTEADAFLDKYKSERQDTVEIEVSLLAQSYRLGIIAIRLGYLKKAEELFELTTKFLDQLGTSQQTAFVKNITTALQDLKREKLSTDAQAFVDEFLDIFAPIEEGSS